MIVYSGVRTIKNENFPKLSLSLGLGLVWGSNLTRGKNPRTIYSICFIEAMVSQKSLQKLFT